MNFLDRINQLNDEVALLRSQLSDARKQLEADSATIAKLSADKRELVSATRKVTSLLSKNVKDFGGCDHSVGVCMCEEIRACDNATEVLSRHA